MPSEPTPASPTPAPQPFTNALLRAVLTTVLCVSVIVMVHGFLSWGLDRDVIPESDANAIVVIAMAGASVLVIFFAILGGLTPERAGHASVARALLAGLAVYVLTPASGAIGYAIATGRAFAFVVFFGSHLLSPFVLATSLVTLVCILLLPLVGRIHSAPR